ncbi:MAG: SsgA family sporulation/cell division regulator [Actinomycetales bacterium]
MAEEGHQGEVTMPMELRLLVPMQQALPLPAQLRYSARDPYAVSIVFSGPDEDVVWVFARDLLAGGMTLPQGQGDVRIRPEIHSGRRFVMIGLTSPDGTAELEADADSISAFVALTEKVVAFGREHDVVNVDEALADLLG